MNDVRSLPNPPGEPVTAPELPISVPRLTEEQMCEAEAVFRSLMGTRHSLTGCVAYTLANDRSPTVVKSVAAAVEEYVAAKQGECDRAVLSGCHLKNIRKELKHLVAFFPHGEVCHLAPDRLTAFCERGTPSNKTVNLRRGILGAFLKFAFQREWIAANPMDRVPRRPVTREAGAPVPTLSAKQAGELMLFLETYRGGELVPFYALCLFAGIHSCLRTGEISKLKAEYIHLDEGRIVIPADISNTHRERVITIQPNLVTWLRAYPSDRFSVVPSAHIRNTRQPVGRQFGLTRDILRHTFIAMFVAKFRSLTDAALQAGISEAVVRKQFLELRSRAEADAFWAIAPRAAVT